MRSQESHHPLIEIATSFLTIGAMSYGGPAIMGIMLALTWIYTTFGALQAVRGAFYGIAPVVLGIFAVAIYRLGTNAIKGIDVTELHNHGIMDTPRLFYMHFGATDDTVKLARGLRAALDQTNSQK